LRQITARIIPRLFCSSLKPTSIYYIVVIETASAKLDFAREPEMGMNGNVSFGTAKY
jgi:hypothetical protein